VASVRTAKWHTVAPPSGRLLNAWYDGRGFENGDKCARTFGTPLGSTATGQYNQVIGSGSSGCVLTGR
jgi:hypothetical protein